MIGALACLSLLNAPARAHDAVKHAEKTDRIHPTAVEWVGFVEFASTTTENHVEGGDLEAAPGAAGTRTGTFTDAMRRYATGRTTITATECASAPGCPVAVAGAFQSSDQSDSKRASRWPRECPSGSGQTDSIRTALDLKQIFQFERGPAPARLDVSWDGDRKVWVIDARLVPGEAPSPVCDDVSSAVESVDPGCGGPTPPPKHAGASPSSGACVRPAIGQTFTISAPADAAQLKGSRTLGGSATPDALPSGAVKQRNGSVVVELKVVYDLRRIESP